MSDLVNIIKENVELYSPVISIHSITDVDGVYTVGTCNTHYINKYRIILVNGIEVKVTSFIKDESFSFSFPTGVEIPDTITEIKIKPFHFFYGTTTSASAEVSKIKNIKDKVPFVWLYAVYSDIVDRSLNKTLKESRIKLFALDQCNYKDWLDIDHHNNVIVPLNEYLNGLLEHLEKYKGVREIGSVENTGRANFGRYVNEGHVEKIFDENLSGVQSDIEIKYLVNKKCCR